MGGAAHQILNRSDLLEMLAIILGIPLLIFGIYQIVRGTLLIIRCSKSNSWPEVSAVITESRVEVEHNSEADVYCPVVKYYYVVNGNRYFGNNLRVSGQVRCMSEKGARALLQRYTLGEHVIAYLSPDFPPRAYLEIGFGARPFWIIVFGLFVAIFAILLLLYQS
jgi:hypothetical protein